LRSRLDYLTLLLLPRFGAALIRKLVDGFGSPGSVLEADPEEIIRVPGAGKQAAATLGDRETVAAARKRAAKQLRRAAASGVRVIDTDDPLFPFQLRTIHDCPLLLYCRGKTSLLGQPAVAVVGSRSASAYGRRIGFELSRSLAALGIVVVSGMALGIDGEAHRGALNGDGGTIGVLGCGPDIVYPAVHAGLYRQVESRGVLVSEYPLGTRPDGFRFPARNRIISGLSLGVVVVEATLRSGSLITARLALEQGREVFAVPGPVDSSRSAGTHWLLKQGARLVQSAEDIVEELQLASSLKTVSSSGYDGEGRSENNLSACEKQVLAVVDDDSRTIDEIIRSSGLSAAEVGDALLQLELGGLVRRLPGRVYQRV